MLGVLAPTASAVIALLALLLNSWRKSRGNSQRQLRDRLRDELRPISVFCDIYFNRNFPQAVREAPKYRPDAIKQIREDGLLSPSSAHLERIEALLREYFDLTHVGGQFRRTVSREEYDRYMADNRARLANVITELDGRSKDYLEALGRMNNGRYSTYVRYRLIPP